MIKAETKLKTIKYILLTTIALILSIVALFISNKTTYTAYADTNAENIFTKILRTVYVPVGYENEELIYQEDAFIRFKIKLSQVGSTEEEFNVMKDQLDNYNVKAFNDSDYFKLTGLELVNNTLGHKWYRTIYTRIDATDLTTVKLDVPVYVDNDTPSWNGPSYWENLQDRIRQIPVGVNLKDFISRSTTDEWYHFTTRAVPVECINEDCPTYDDGHKYHYFKLDHIEPSIVTPGTDYYKVYYSDYTHQSQEDLKYDLKIPYQISNGEILYNNSKTEYCNKIYVKQLFDNEYFIDLATLKENLVEFNGETYNYLKNKIAIKTTDCESGCNEHYFDIEGIEFESYSTDFDVCRATYKLIISTEYHQVTVHYTDATPNNTTDTIFIAVGDKFSDYHKYENSLFEITGAKTWNQDSTGFGVMIETLPADITSHAHVFLQYKKIKIPVELNFFDTERNLNTKTVIKTVDPADFYDGKIDLRYGVEDSFIYYTAYPHQDMLQTTNLSTWYCTSNDFELEWRTHTNSDLYDYNLKSATVWTEPDYSKINCGSCKNLTKWFYDTASQDPYFATSDDVSVDLYHLTVKVTQTYEDINKPVVLYAGHTKVMCDFLTNSENAFKDISPNISYEDCKDRYFWLGLTYPGYTLFDFVGDVLEGVTEVTNNVARFSLGLILDFLDAIIPDWLKIILGIALGLFLIYWIVRFILWAIKMAKKPLNTKTKKRRKRNV